MDDLLNNALFVHYFVFWYSPTEWCTMPIAVSCAGNREDVLPTPVTSASVSASVSASTAAMTTSEYTPNRPGARSSPRTHKS